MGDDDMGVIYRQIGDVTANPVTQTVFLWFFGLIVACWAVAGVVELVRTRRSLILVLLPSAALVSALEPITDVFGHLYIFEQGAHIAYTLVGRGMPWWVVFGHMTAWTGMGILGRFMVTRGYPPRKVVLFYLGLVISNILVEAPVTKWGLESYFGSQPLAVLGTFPLFWSFSNQAAGLVAGLAIGAVWQRLTGWRILAIVPLLTSAIGAGLWFCAWPMWVFLNTDSLTSSTSLWITVPASLLVIAFSVTYVYAASRIFRRIESPDPPFEAIAGPVRSTSACR